MAAAAGAPIPPEVIETFEHLAAVVDAFAALPGITWDDIADTPAFRQGLDVLADAWGNTPVPC